MANDTETDSEYQKEAAKHVPDKMVAIKGAFEPKAYASKNKSRCPVEFYKAFRSHLSEAMLDPDAPFYLAINHQRKPSDKVYGIWIGPSERMKLASSSRTPLLQPNSMRHTRRRNF